MGTYEDFAGVYDIFQDNIDYQDWAAFLKEKLCGYGIRDGLVLDLGCGTGTMTELLSGYGYDMIGVDSSDEMLMQAYEKREQSGSSILYLRQDMTEFELYGTVRAIVSVCDSLNYLLTEEELLQTFRLVNNYLDPAGIFIFDMNTAYKYRQIGSSVIAENRDEGSFIWENDFDEEEGINEYDLTLFLPREDGLYEKSEEYHCQRAYGPETIKSLLEEAGLTVLGVFDGYSDAPPFDESERLVFIAREKGKKDRL